MGNRAVITTQENFDSNGVGVYLHWNGGRDSVRAFLAYCDIQGYKCPENNNYGWARLCQVVGNFFGGDSSLGIDTIDQLDCDNYDNGVYIIENWKIVGRKYISEGFQEQDRYDLLEFLRDINDGMPEELRVEDETLVAYAEAYEEASQ